MAAIGDLLFFRRGGPDLDDYLRAKVDGLRQVVDGIPEAEFAAKSDQGLAETAANQARVVPLEVDFEAASSNVRETTVDVTGRFDYDMGDGRRARVPGLRATKTIPFRGDPQLWRMKTNPWGMNPPRGEVRGQTVTVGIEVPAAEAEAARNYIEECVAKMPEYLDRHSAQIDRHNAGLRAQVLPLIQQRRVRLTEADDLRKKLQG